MKSYIENIRKSLKKLGHVPTSDVIRTAINFVCPDGKNVLENKTAIINETIKLINSRELSSDHTPADSNQHVDEELINYYRETDINKLSDSEIDINKSSEIVVGEGEKHELITAQASCLGIELSEVEVVDLASEIKDDFLDYESFIEEIVGVIVAYNDNRTSGLEQKIKDAREHIESRRKQLNKTLVGEFAEMNNFFRQGEAKRKELSKVIAAAFKT
jgi:hypothetical protein